MPANITPTLLQLGSIMHARTVDPDGNELGTFTTETRPTAVGATTKIGEALDIVTPRLGNVPERLAAMGRSIVALRAAMYVEAAYYPNETGMAGEPTAYQAYKEQYEAALADFDEAAAGNVGVGRKTSGSIRVRTVYTTGT